MSIAQGSAIPLKRHDHLKLGLEELAVQNVVTVPEPVRPPVQGVPPLPSPLFVSPQAGDSQALQAAAMDESSMSEEWETRLDSFLKRPEAAVRAERQGEAPRATAAAPTEGRAPYLGRGIRADVVAGLPPPIVVLQDAPLPPPSSPARRNDVSVSEGMDEGPLAAFLAGRPAQPAKLEHLAAPAAMPSVSPVSVPDTPPPLQPEPLPSIADLTQLLNGSDVAASAPPRLAPVARHAGMPPDAAFLHGIGIGLPLRDVQMAAETAYDLGRALAALADFLVETAHRDARISGQAFAALPTGALALSEIVSARDYLPGDVELAVRQVIRQIRELQAEGHPGAVVLDPRELEPGRLLLKWRLDAGHRATPARAWTLYKAHFGELIEQASRKTDKQQRANVGSGR